MGYSIKGFVVTVNYINANGTVDDKELYVKCDEEYNELDTADLLNKFLPITRNVSEVLEVIVEPTEDTEEDIWKDLRIDD